MRLLDTSALKVKTFNANTPEYAILSHTWGTDDDEVTFQELQTPSPETPLKKGYIKIKRFCEVARLNGYDWAWIDTCCIDKTSSAELSESINSMYKWYRDSDVCYAYLEDVQELADIKSSRWFTRGWTLQELLGPQHLEFYNDNWEELSSKQDLREVISETTGIEPMALVGSFVPQRYTVAVRMSWAASRITTREEDIAYSLLGLFNVNMPLIYGEGGKAFQRLQEEILKDTEDYTLLAWRSRPKTADDMSLDPTGILARSPWDFRNGRLATEKDGWSYASIRLIDWNPFDVSEANFRWKGRPLIEGWVPSKDFEPPRLTSRGLRITLPFLTSLSPATDSQDEASSLAFLYSTCPFGEMVCLALHKNDVVNSSVMKGDYYRILASNNPRFITATSVKFEFRTVYIRSKPREERLAVSSWTRTEHQLLVLSISRNGQRLHEPYLDGFTRPRYPFIYTVHIGVKLVYLVVQIGETPYCFIEEPTQQVKTHKFDWNRLASAANRFGKLIFRMEMSTGDSLQCSVKRRGIGWRKLVASGMACPERASRIQQATNLYSLDFSVESADASLPIWFNASDWTV